MTYHEGDEENFTLGGGMTIRDVTRAVVFVVTAALAQDPVTGSTTPSIRMTDFGIDLPNAWRYPSRRTLVRAGGWDEPRKLPENAHAKRPTSRVHAVLGAE